VYPPGDFHNRTKHYRQRDGAQFDNHAVAGAGQAFGTDVVYEESWAVLQSTGRALRMKFSVSRARSVGALGQAD
jgi:hypothetical protein